MLACSVAASLRSPLFGRSHPAWLLAILALGVATRLLLPSPETILWGDPAFLTVWSRLLAESDGLGLAGAVEAARGGGIQGLTGYVLANPTGALYGLLYGLYENPEKVTRLVDVLLLAGWFRVVGFSVGSAEALMTLISLGTLVTTYVLAWRIWRDRLTALAAAALMAIAPSAVTSSHFVSWHVFGQLGVMLAVLAAWWALRPRDAGEGPRLRTLAMAGAVWGLTLYTNTVLLPALVPLIALPVFWARAEDRGSGRRRIGVVARWVAVYVGAGLIVFSPALAFIAARWDVFAARNLGYYGSSYLGAALAAKVGALGATAAAAVTVPLLLAGAVGAAAAWRRGGPGGQILITWIGVYVLLALAVGIPPVQPRMILMVVPALVLLAAAGIRAMATAAASNVRAPDGRVLAAVTAPFLIWAGVQVAPAYGSSPRSVEWRAMETLLAEARPGTVMVSDRPRAPQVLATHSHRHTFIRSSSLLERSAGQSADDDALARYMEWRHPGLSLPLDEAYVVLRTVGSGTDEGTAIIRATETMTKGTCVPYRPGETGNLSVFRCSDARSSAARSSAAR